MDALGIDMLKDGRYMPPELLTAGLVNELAASRPFYPSGKVELLDSLLEEGIECELLQCRYLTKDGRLSNLLDIIDGMIPIDEESLKLRLERFKEFCDLEQVLGTEQAMVQIVRPIDDPSPLEEKVIEPEDPPKEETQVAAVAEVSPAAATLPTEIGSEGLRKSSEEEECVKKERLRTEFTPFLVSKAVPPDGTLWAESVSRVMNLMHETSKGTPLMCPSLQPYRYGERLGMNYSRRAAIIPRVETRENIVPVRAIRRRQRPDG